jgi:hypothetical protein
VLDDANETLDYGTRGAAANPEGGNIVKGKIVLGGLAVIGILVLSATGAHASGGGLPSALTGFFVCHEIEGNDPGQTFDVESPIFGPVDALGAKSNCIDPTTGLPGTPCILQKVKMLKGSLACAWARLFPPREQGAPAPDPIEPGSAEKMTCYPISPVPPTAKSTPAPHYDVFDPLFVDQLDIAVPQTAMRYLCAPSGYFPQ